MRGCPSIGTCVVLVFLAAARHAVGGELPLVAYYAMEPDRGDTNRLVDSGPHGLHGWLTGGVSYVAGGRRGGALRFTGRGENRAMAHNKGVLARVGSPLTVTAWIRPDGFAERGKIAAIVTKRRPLWKGTPFSFSVTDNGALSLDANVGKGWRHPRTVARLVKGKWTHVAFTWRPDREAVLYVDGKPAGREKIEGTLASSDEPLVFGCEDDASWPGGGRSKYRGLIDEVRIYAAVLTAGQIRSDMKGRPPATRPARAADFVPPTHWVKFRLARWDMPLGFRSRGQMTRQLAARSGPPDVVDWPQLTFDGEPVFAEGPTDGRFVPLYEDPKNRPLFRQGYDKAVEPGGHWLRPVAWLWGQRVIYTTDRTARTSGSEYELWTFPVTVRGEEDGVVRKVVLKHDGRTIYERDFGEGTVGSVTLLLPQNEPGRQYELTVNGRGPVEFDAGLRAVEPGHPREVPIAFSLELPDVGPKITVATPERPHRFPNPDEWRQDGQTMRQLAAYWETREALEAADANVVPVLGHWKMEPDPEDGKRLVDAGPFGLHGELVDGAGYADGRRGKALRLGGGKARAVVGKSESLDSLTDDLTLTAWIRPDELPKGDLAMVVTKRPGWWTVKPFSLDIATDGSLCFGGNDGSWAPNTRGPRAVQAGRWQHVAFTYKAGGELVLYHDGKAIKRRRMPNPLSANKDPLVFGWEQGGDFNGGKYVGFRGLIDDAKLYAAALTGEQVRLDMEGKLRTRGATVTKSPVALPFDYERKPKSMRERLGVEVPRSPVSTIGVSLTHGMSGGWFFHSENGPAFKGSLEEYARHAADVGFDLVFEQVKSNNTPPRDGRSYERWLAALAERGVRGGLDIITLNNSNQALYSYSLPDFHRPKHRDIQLVMQRFVRFPNFAGGTMGTDNACYEPFWDWAPPHPNRPWAEAHSVLMPPAEKIPVGPGIQQLKPRQRRARSQREFVEYIKRYDETFRQYDYFALAVIEVDEIEPDLVFTTGSFGSSPGVLGRGGWAAGSVPGEPMHRLMPVQTAYDWNETDCAKPMHNVALVDRLRSYYPEKPTWALIDDFRTFLGRGPLQRAYALALTRGVKGVGPQILPHTTGDAAKQKVDWVGAVSRYREVFAWVRRYGGAYAMTDLAAAIGIPYVHEQAISRPCVAGRPADEVLFKASHEGKTTEALFMCHAAGWPARIVTPEEIRRGLPASMKALLLVGLNRFDDSWVWHEGLEGKLRAFVDGGGRILLDHESVSPVEAVKTGMKVRAYIPQGGGGTGGPSLDETPVLIRRNAGNIRILRGAMNGVARPVAVSEDPTVWAVPHVSGDTQYVTVVNQGWLEGKSASKIVKPQVGKLVWNTERPIYDIRLGRKVTPKEASRCDLTKDAFRLYALPPREVTKPSVEVKLGHDGFFEAKASAGLFAGRPMTGVPVELTVTRGEESATVYTATGLTAKLPLSMLDSPFVAEVRATELLSGLSASVRADREALAHRYDKGPVRFFHGPSIYWFAGDKDVRANRIEISVTIALTPEQSSDQNVARLAEKLRRFLAGRGRDVSVGKIEPNGLVLGLQPYESVQRFPQWRTVETDLVLFGTAATNPLLLDQARGFILPETGEKLAPGHGAVSYAWSPFVGEFDAVNIVARDAAGLEAAVEALIRMASDWADRAQAAQESAPTEKAEEARGEPVATRRGSVGDEGTAAAEAGGQQAPPSGKRAPGAKSGVGMLPVVLGAAVVLALVVTGVVVLSKKKPPRRRERRR